MTDIPGARTPGARLSRRTLLRAGAWLAALGCLGFYCFWGATGHMLDLQVYRDGALAIRHGHALYSMITPMRLGYTYPPVGALLALPLSLVPFALVKAVWAGLICVALAVTVWFGFRPLLARAGPSAPTVLVAAVAGCALLYPVQQEFYFGQVDLFLVALCLLDLCARQPRWPRGLLIGLAAAIKLEPGLFIIYLLITKRRKEALVAALSFAAWTALAWLVDPRDSAAYWTDAIFHTSRLGGNASAGNQSLRGLILRAFKPEPAPAAAWLALALVVGAAGLAAAWSCWRRGHDMAGIAITGLLSAELSPVAWFHHYCWMIVALGVVVGEGRHRPRIAAAAVIFALFVTKLPQWAQSLIGSGRLAAVPGRLLEDSFGLAALAVIVIMYRLRPSPAELRARLPGTSGGERAAPRLPASEREAPATAGLPEPATPASGSAADSPPGLRAPG
jgi:alpha-1,2-mannosyltransferase